MTLRIGDLLLQQGVITQAELEEALKYQVVFGGKLGTNLIEMGVLEEEDINRALSRKFNVPPVDLGQITKIAPEAIAAIPAELAGKYRVLPLAVEGRRLTLAMVDPADLKAIDEIAFRTGLIVRPQVVAELRLLLALEKYYGIERDRRYIHTVKKVESKKKRQLQAPAPPPPPEIPPLPQRKNAGIAKPAPTASSRPEAVSPAPIPFPLPPADEELLDLEEADIHEEVEIPEEETGKPESESIEPLSEESVAETLVEAQDRDEIFAAILGSLAREFPRCALFLVRGDLAMGWQCTVERKALRGFDQLQIPLGEPSVLKTVAEGKSFYLGPIPRSPFNSLILQAMGETVPAAALLVPLMMMGRVIGILYVDGSGINLGDRLFDLQKLTARAAMAFEILVLKNKILSL